MSTDKFDDRRFALTNSHAESRQSVFYVSTQAHFMDERHHQACAGTYTIPYGDRAYHYEVGLKTGPVRVVSTNAVPIITSERAYRDVSANLKDFNEMMGMPASQLTAEYWFPWYDNTSFMQTYLMISNAQ